MQAVAQNTESASVLGINVPRMIFYAFAINAVLAVAAAGHLYQYLTRRPAVLLQIPGLITLVPGSMGFRGLHALIEQDSAAGINLITDMLLTGAALAVGLLLADNIAGWLIARLDRQAARCRATTK